MLLKEIEDLKVEGHSVIRPERAAMWTGQPGQSYGLPLRITASVPSPSCLVPFLISARASRLHWELLCGSFRSASFTHSRVEGSWRGWSVALEKNVRRSRNSRCQLHRDIKGRGGIITDTAIETGK